MEPQRFIGLSRAARARCARFSAKATMKIFNNSRTPTPDRASSPTLQDLAVLQFLVATGLALSSGRSLAAVLQASVQNMVDCLGAGLARIWILTKTNDALELQASAGECTEFDGGTPIETAVIAQIAAGRQPYITDQLQNDSCMGAWAKSQGFVAFAGHPLIYCAKLIGVTGVFSRESLGCHVVQALAVTAANLATTVERRSYEAVLEQVTAELTIKNDQLDQAHQRARLLIDSVPNGILLVNRAGTITLANIPAATLFGYDLRELEGQPVETLMPAEYRAKHEGQRSDFSSCPETRARAMRSGRSVFAARKDGSCFPAEVDLKAFDVDGEAGILCSIVDITERNRMEARLLETERLRESDRLKSEFLANMSHEIRTPMNVLIGMSGLLMDSELTPCQQDYVKSIQKGAEALLVLINDVLDFSKMEAGRLNIDSLDFSPDSVVEDTCDFLSQQAHRKGLEFTCCVRPDVPGWLRGDAGRLRQILTNLIGNAIKFTEKGEVNLSVTLGAPVDGKTLVHFAVTDTGIGISAQVKGRLFQAFTQADGSTTRKYGGSGLGLAICRRLVTLMGGTIDVESEWGKGSRFWFELPFDAPSEIPALDTDAAASLAGLRALVVDDVESSRSIAIQYLNSWQMKSDSADNALLAVKMIREAAALDQPYSLVLLDYGMDGLTGVDLARIIKTDKAIASTPIIMLTSLDERRAAHEAKETGILNLLTKPVRKQPLRQAVISAVKPRAIGAAAATPQKKRETKARRGVKLLLVEDNEDNQKLAVRLFEKHGYDCDIASNGLEALDRLARENYPLVLMDCQMPEMDGFEATAEIRQREQQSNWRTPIIAMTAHALVGDREKCLAAGMDDYVSKPINEALFFRIIELWLTSANRVAPEPGEQTPVTPAPAERIRVHALAGVADLVPKYLANRKRDILSLAEALKKGDLQAVRVIGHGMKGTGSGYGFPAITEIGRNIEKAGVSEDAAAITRQISSLENYLSRLEVIY